MPRRRGLGGWLLIISSRNRCGSRQKKNSGVLPHHDVVVQYRM